MRAPSYLKNRISVFVDAAARSLDRRSRCSAAARDRPAGRLHQPAAGGWLMDAIIYHNPDCGTSRNTLALIRNAGIEPHVIEYLKTPPTPAMVAAARAADGHHGPWPPAREGHALRRARARRHIARRRALLEAMRLTRS